MQAASPSMTAVQLCNAAGLKHPHTSLPEISQSPRAFLDALVTAGYQMQAVIYLAHAIPVREGIWWAWTTARKLGGTGPAEAGALAAAEKWLLQPTDDNRVGCRKAAAVLPPNGATAALCDAIFFTGNLAAPGAPPVPAPEFSSSKFVGACIILCACQANPRDPAPRFQACIGQGLEIVRRINLWEQPV
jgi:hypothetical protein